EYGEAILLAIILALFIRTFVVQAFKIPSGSMVPTLTIGDHILVTKFLYDLKLPYWDKILVRFSEPQRGDIIVFKFPEDESKDFIKRVIGLPGDTVEVRNKRVWINGEPHRVAGQADHAFDEVLALVLRELEHDDVAPLGFGEPDQDLVPVRQFEVVQEFRDEDVVADRQGRHHGAGGDFEGLDDEGPDEEGQ